MLTFKGQTEYDQLLKEGEGTVVGGARVCEERGKRGNPSLQFLASWQQLF